MSYTTIQSTAIAVVPDYPETADTNYAAKCVHDFCVNNPDQVPEALEDLDSDDFVDEISGYLDVKGKRIEISLDTEEANYNIEIFDFLSGYFARCNDKPFLEVNGSSFDSREGTSGWTTYLDREGREIDIYAALDAYCR